MARAWQVAPLLAVFAPSDAAVLMANTSEHSLMRREMIGAGANFVEVNPAESSRRYSSIWGNNRIGTGHARSMTNSAQAWSARHNNKDQWMTIDMGSQKAVDGVYFQARNCGSCCCNQVVTDVHFEYSKDCTTYTPLENNRIFKTGVAQRSASKYLVQWAEQRVAKCVKICVDGWQNHISMRASLYARTPEQVDKESVEYVAMNPPESSRKYSSVWGNNRIGTGHARSMLDSVQAWSARWNRKGEWMSIQLSRKYKIGGVFFQARNKGSCCGNQIVTQVSFETSSDCRSYSAVDDGKVYLTGVNVNDNVKHFVKWDQDVDAKCVKIKIDNWSGHVSMRAAVAVAYLDGKFTTALLQEEEINNETMVDDAVPDLPQPGFKTPPGVYGDGTEAHVTEDFPPEIQDFSHYGDGTPSFEEE